MSLPTTTTAAVLHSFGGTHTIEQVELRPPGPFEALVRISAAGVCHSDVGQADGEWQADLPLVLGHEGSGVVEAVGPGVAVPVGTRVVLNMAPGCGACTECSQGRPILCQLALDAMSQGRLLTGPTPIKGSAGPVGTYALLGCFAQHAIVQARSLIPLPDHVPDSVGALIGCAVITGLGAAIGSIDIAAGSRGAVFGAGGVGVNAIQGARARGASEIIAVDPSEQRRELSRRFGATDVVDSADAERIAAYATDARHHGLDWTIASVGNAASMRTAVELLRPGGVACMVGLPREGDDVRIDMLDVVTFEKHIVGSAYGTLAPTVLVPRIVEMYRRGQLLLDELIGDTLPLHSIDEAFALSREAKGLRTIIRMSA